MLLTNAKSTPQTGKTGEAALPDMQLIHRVRAGDPIAFELIMRRYNQRLFRLVRSMLRNEAEAEDVVQETYVRAYTKLGDFIGPQGFSSWLCRIAVNEALGRLRQKNRVISLEEYQKADETDAAGRPEEAMTDSKPTPERLAANGELRRLLEEAIDALPDGFRAVFVLRAIEGMSVAETAEVLAIKPETVKTRFYRARRLLQGAIGARIGAVAATAFEFAGERCDRIVASVFLRLGSSIERSPSNLRSGPGPVS